ERKDNIAGMSIGGGKRENFFFCLLEHFPDQNRWFLTALNQVKDEEVSDSDEAIRSWIKEFDLKKLMIDFPLTKPPCELCQLECPGTEKCHNEVVVNVRTQIELLLSEDKENHDFHPKTYEREREVDNQVYYSRDEFFKESTDHMLSKSFKRKLKKGFLPYWNRPLDVWIWQKYYDQLLSLFKVSYDSFGNTSLMLMARFKYLLRHFPGDLAFFESDVRLTLLELYRSGIISKNHIMNLQDLEQAVFARLEIIKCIEDKLGIFIYEKDKQVIARKPRAFDSFLLAIAGQRELMNEIISIPKWTQAHNANFIIPHFDE
ncbi:MAG: hypothetical protein ACI9QD_000869, partial [Thermoproteota archaeon]